MKRADAIFYGFLMAVSVAVWILGAWLVDDFELRWGMIAALYASLLALMWWRNRGRRSD